MATLRASSAEAQLLAALRDGRLNGQVHSTFARTINVVTREGQLYALASRWVDNAPDTAIVDVADFASSGVRAGDAVWCKASTLALGATLEVCFDQADAWECRLAHYPADERRLQANLAIMRDAIGACARTGDPAHTAAASAAAADAMRTRLDDSARALHASLCQGELPSACRHARALVGLGPGLTPSGDDLLVGLLAVLHMRESPCGDSSRLGAAIVADARQRTNPISAAALEAAAGGRVRESVAHLIQMLVTGSDAALREALARVLAIGSSSGRDMIAGVVCGIEAHLEASARQRLR